NNASGDPQADPVGEWFGPESMGLNKIARIETPFWRTQPFPPPFLPVTLTPEEDRRNLAKLARPGVPIVTTGRTGFDFPEKKPDLLDYEGRPPRDLRPTSTRNWISIAAQVDLIEQDIYFGTADYPEGSYLTIVGVHLQRMDESEPWLGWRDVDVYLPFNPPKRPEVIDPVTGASKLSAVQEYRMLVESKQRYIARSQLPERITGDKVIAPPIPYYPDPPQSDDDPNDLAKKWRSLAEKAINGKKPFGARDPDAAFVLARAAVGVSSATAKERDKAQEILDRAIKTLRKNRDRKQILNSSLRSAERLMPIVAHDLDAIPGHTYVYRIRYEALNNYAGIRGELKNPADAERLTVFSPWSPISRKVAPRSDIYFYLTKANRNRGEVTVTVYKKKKSRGGFDEAKFKVKVGDEIGGEKRLGKPKGDFSTGSVCVDLDFRRKVDGKTTVAMVYVDQNDGSLRERFLSLDTDDAFRKQLDEKRTARR
ncbi:MAG: hypothetical protein ACE5EC_08515, partial [Phycisphaerae bacterium]